MKALGLIAGNGQYPMRCAEAARRAGIARIVAVAFEGETEKDIETRADEVVWLKVGQLDRLIGAFRDRGVGEAVMVGQIAPRNLFRDLRPDLRMTALLARLKVRNAETIFGAVAAELEKDGIRLIDARTYLEDSLTPVGHVAGPRLSPEQNEDVRFGVRIVRAVSALDIGQTVVVKRGTVLAVEAFEGTDEAIRRGGRLGGGHAVVVKASKHAQDMRFDVPVVGSRTLDVARESGADVLAVEAGRTLLLDRPELKVRARRFRISLVGWEAERI